MGVLPQGQVLFEEGRSIATMTLEQRALCAASLWCPAQTVWHPVCTVNLGAYGQVRQRAQWREQLDVYQHHAPAGQRSQPTGTLSGGEQQMRTAWAVRSCRTPNY